MYNIVFIYNNVYLSNIDKERIRASFCISSATGDISTTPLISMQTHRKIRKTPTSAFYVRRPGHPTSTYPNTSAGKGGIEKCE